MEGAFISESKSPWDCWVTVFQSLPPHIQPKKIISTFYLTLAIFDGELSNLSSIFIPVNSVWSFVLKMASFSLCWCIWLCYVMYIFNNYMVFYAVKCSCRLDLGLLKDHSSWKTCWDTGTSGMVLWFTAGTNRQRLVLGWLCQDSEDGQLQCKLVYHYFPKIGWSFLLTQSEPRAYLSAWSQPRIMICLTTSLGVP